MSTPTTSCSPSASCSDTASPVRTQHVLSTEAAFAATGTPVPSVVHTSPSPAASSAVPEGTLSPSEQDHGDSGPPAQVGKIVGGVVGGVAGTLLLLSLLLYLLRPWRRRRMSSKRASRGHMDLEKPWEGPSAEGAAPGWAGVLRRKRANSASLPPRASTTDPFSAQAPVAPSIRDDEIISPSRRFFTLSRLGAMLGLLPREDDTRLTHLFNPSRIFHPTSTPTSDSGKAVNCPQRLGSHWFYAGASMPDVFDHIMSYPLPNVPTELTLTHPSSNMDDLFVPWCIGSPSAFLAPSLAPSGMHLSSQTSTSDRLGSQVAFPPLSASRSKDSRLQPSPIPTKDRRASLLPSKSASPSVSPAPDQWPSRVPSGSQPSVGVLTEEGAASIASPVPIRIMDQQVFSALAGSAGSASPLAYVPITAPYAAAEPTPGRGTLDAQRLTPDLPHPTSRRTSQLNGSHSNSMHSPSRPTASPQALPPTTSNGCKSEPQPCNLANYDVDTGLASAPSSHYLDEETPTSVISHSEWTDHRTSSVSHRQASGESHHRPSSPMSPTPTLVGTAATHSSSVDASTVLKPFPPLAALASATYPPSRYSRNLGRLSSEVAFDWAASTAMAVSRTSADVETREHSLTASTLAQRPPAPTSPPNPASTEGPNNLTFPARANARLSRSSAPPPLSPVVGSPPHPSVEVEGAGSPSQLTFNKGFPFPPSARSGPLVVRNGDERPPDAQ